METRHVATGDYLLADVVGFRVSTLRVRVRAVLSDGTCAVVTADLSDAGTSLLLAPEKLRPLSPAPAPVFAHPTALVALGGAR